MAYLNLVRMRRALDAALLSGVSALALIAGSQPSQAASKQTLGSVAPTVAAQQAATAAALQAAEAAAQAQTSLNRAAEALAAAQRLQGAAAAAGSALFVPNGLVTGGLVPTDPTYSTNQWTGADAPVQSTSGSQVTVNIQQTAAKALLNWNSFNVGANTTVDFQQQQSNWIAINRVIDPSLAPSTILGHINALGGVYLINGNGIIFGAGSQINVNTLIASSLDITSLGVSQGTAVQGSFAYSGAAPLAASPSNPCPGCITVERGATITANIATDLVPQGSPGDIYLFGTNVYNHGWLSAPTGEIGMVAARAIDLIPNGFTILPASVLGTDASGTVLPYKGTEFSVTSFSQINSSGNVVGGYLPGTGAVVHDGLIQASRGNVIMQGDTVTIDNPRDAGGNLLTDAATGSLVQGVISADTSIDRNSFVMLRAATSVTMNGVITSLPYDDGASPLPIGGSAGSTVQSFTPPYIEMTAQSTVTMGSSGLISAPSAVVSLRALNLTDSILYQPTANNPSANQLFFRQDGSPVPSSTSGVAQSVLLSPGAVIDVAGLENVTLPASYNYISFQPRAEFADMPVQRNGPLNGQTLWIDINDSGTRSDGTSWVGTPLADASGYVSGVGRSIYQLMTAGGSVNLQTDLNANSGGGKVQTAGSVINVAGGSENFQAGWVPTTLLLGADGRIYTMANADPNRVYVGFANQFTVDHSRWGITQTWSTQTYASGYSQGEAAGSVNVTTVNPSLLGTIYFGSVAGQRQIENGQLPSQGSLSLTTPSSVQIGSTGSADYTTQSTVTVLSADILSGYGLSSLSITANDLVVSSASTLNLAPGGSFSVLAGAIDIAGNVAAAGGTISLKTDRASLVGTTISPGPFSGSLFKAPTDSSGQVLAANIYVEGTLDVSGRFVNDTGHSGSDIVGPADINGGKITIATDIVSNVGAQDWTGSILLAKSSLLDVSSGGYIAPSGQPKLASTTVMAGQAGSISLGIYQGNVFTAANGNPTITSQPTSGQVAFIELDGSLRGYGFQSNGSLSLSGVDNIQIGGTLPSGATSDIRIGGVPAPLPVSLFTGGGFGSYTIQAVSDGRSIDAKGDTTVSNITVAAGVNLALQQQNFLSPVGSSGIDYSTVATGTKLGQLASPALSVLPADQRQPVNLTLNADHILLDTGSTIITDPKSSITLGNLSYDPQNATGSLPAQSVTLLGSIIDHGGSVFINATATQLGSQALVDLSGTFVASSMFGWQSGSLTSGTYLPGGTFQVEAGTYTTVTEGSAAAGTNFTYNAYLPPSGSSYLVANSGAEVDVSGAAGLIQVAGPRGTNSSVWAWTDAGTVSADVAGFAWGGGFAAAGGRYAGADGKTYADPRANNGTIILGGGAINLSQDTSAIASVLSNFQQGTPPNALYVAASQLAPFDNVYLYAGAATGGATRIFTDLNGNIFGYAPPSFAAFNILGSVNLDVVNRLHIAAADISASPISPSSSINAQLTAPYIELTGGGGSTSVGSSTLTIRGQTIDVEGAAFSGFSQVNLISGGDIRLSTPKVADGYIPTGNTVPNDAESFSGKLLSAGNLLLSAQRIYPVSAVTFTIQTPGNVQFTAPAGSNTSIPLTAGGGIDVFASTIDQAGNLFAPLGQITLGNTNTAAVTLEPGSLTSVSLANTVVPYGATVDGSSWYYNASLTPLSQPPSKGVVLAGSNVSVTQGSTIDLRGGGDLQAMEWVAGKGGSRDTLTTTPSGQTVYALVPSANAPVAAYDIDFATSRSLNNGVTITAGDTNPLVGTQITIAGGGGIAAGTYTLYPAHYATLPGAMRVTVYQKSDLGLNIPSGTTLSDGTVLVTGTITQSTAPGKFLGPAVFAVQTNAVWQSYSEYQFSSANSYFAKQAAKNGTIIPLPIDAGSLQVSALQSIDLRGVFLGQPGQDSSGNLGHGSELDISSPQMIDVVGDAQYTSGNVPAGYLAIDVSQLDNAGFDSILIGGLRTTTTSGTLIAPTSAGILVDTRGEAFTAPEILLVATPTTTATSQSPIPTPAPNTGNITIASGSVINTTGTVNEASGRNYYFGALPGTAAKSVATALGGTLDSTGTVITGANATLSTAGLAALQSYVQNTTGSLFVATNDSTLNASGPTATPLTVKFASGGSMVVAADAGKVTLGSGASITTGALTLQATGSTQSIAINTNDLHVGQLNLAAQTIALGSTSPLSNVSLPLYNFQFADVGGLTLKALSGTITIYGNYNPGQGVNSLTLDAAALEQASGGGDAVISTGGLLAGVGTITLLNSGAATGLTSPLATPQTTLSFDAPNIVLGRAGLTSAQTILGYANVDLNAIGSVSIAGPGSLTLGTSSDAVNLNVATPGIVVAGASGANNGSFAIATGGNISVVNSFTQSGVASRPADSSDVGGNLALTAASISVGSVIQAQAGTITLEATTGDVTLNPRAYLDAAGYASALVDVVTYVAGGKVVLQSDRGNVNTSAFSVIDVAQPAGGLGYGGEIDVTATSGNATLNGSLLGSGGPGHGGTFNLDIQGKSGQSFDLTSLADQLLVGGFTGSINVHTQDGNLVLAANHTLKANSITLTADDPTWVGNDVNQELGQVFIGGVIDASGYAGTTTDGAGEAGGQVSLYGANSVTLASTGVINASTTHVDQRGGDVTIGIGWNAQSKIYLQQGTQINVSGGTRGGLSGGTVTFDAPRDGSNDMKIAVLSNVLDPATGTFDELPTISGITINGARSVTFDGYVAFDTTSSNYGINGASLGWNGIVDPAGWYNSDGSLATSGTWTNVTGWEITGLSKNGGFTSVPTSSIFLGVGSSGSGATFNFQMGVSQFTPAGNPGFGPNQSNIPVTFQPPASGGVAAQGIASTDANGVLSIAITNPGSGYTSPPTFATVGGFTVNALTKPAFGNFGPPVSQSFLQIDSVQIASLGSGYGPPSSGSTTITATISQGNATATVTFAETLGSGKYSDQSGVVSFTPNQNNFIPFQSSGVFSAFNPTTQNTAGVATFTGATFNGSTVVSATSDYTFFNTILEQVTQGTWSYNGQNYGFSNLFTRLQPLVSQLGAGVVQVQPGVQLVNSSKTINSGNITVASNWNLASGSLYDKTTNATPAFYDPANDYVAFNYRLTTPWGVDPGSLSLRALGNINVDASISDGFFQFGNYLDPNYVASVAAYIATIEGESSVLPSNRTFSNDYTYYLNGYSATSAVPVAPYNPFANAVSPSSQNLAAADLFPNSLNVCTSACGTASANVITVTAPSSWSYTLTAGADLASANPTARISLAGANAANKGDVIVANHSSYTQQTLTATSTLQPVTVNLPTMVRTGTGDITVAAARDVVMQDTTAPGVIYAAGVNMPLLPGANYSGGSSVIAGNPDGFLEPQVLAYGYTPSMTYYGPPTAAAFPEMGGDVLVDAQRDIVGYSGSGNKAPQYYQPWLLADSSVTPAQSRSTGGSVSPFGAGVFAPSGPLIASQTSWWIQYSSFQQGFLSAGGNVTVVAGRDLIDTSVSLPTTGRVSGGLSADSTPVTHLYGSGNMVVRAGRNILGGSFYEGSGEATIFARGAIGQNGTVSRYPSSPVQLPDLPLLAVDTGTIEMVSLGSLSIAGVVNPAALQAQRPSWANPLETGATPAQALYFDTYGPGSGASLIAETGNLTIAIAPTAISDNSNSNSPIAAAPATYPASLQAIALNGNLDTTGIQSIVGQKATIPMPGIVLSPSDHGTFELLAQGSVDLTFGFPDNTQLLVSTPRPYISAGSALIDTGFDPFQPNSGFDGSSSGALLAHADDTQAGIDATARIYAVTGNIKATGNYGASYTGDVTKTYQIIQINRPTEIYAGADITDLNIIIQNIHPSDVSTITAGGNIAYTGFNNGGGIQVAGPGSLIVQAGGDIGPFLPTNVDNKASAQVQEGIASVGNASATPVGDIYLSSYSVGIYDQALFGPVATPRRNTELTAAAGSSQGASIDVLFGIKSPPDYQAMIDSYINPATAGTNQNYALNVNGLQAYLAQLGYIPTDPQSALNTLADLQSLLPIILPLLTPSQRVSFINDLSAFKTFLTQLGYEANNPQSTLGVIFSLLPRSQQLPFINQVLASQNYLLAPGDHTSTDPQDAWAVFQQLSPAQQHLLIDQVFFAEIKSVAKKSPTATTCPQVCQPAWTVINTLFPSGHAVGTSELNLLHGTIQTRLGGDVSIFGPGGSITVGSLSTEPNPNLRLRDLGILTLGGGNINTYTDGNVLVNSSRVLTTQGGDVLMWTSYGDLDAGRGSKTIVSAPALQVQFDQNDYETIDPGGYVTGSGIATLQASSTAAVSNLYLVAPNGTIDFGTAGVRSSGQLVVVAPVLVNQSNATFATSNITPNVNVGGLTAGSNTAGAASKPADIATASGQPANDHASVFIVEVVGYGGGDNSNDPTSGGDQNSGAQ